MKTGLYANAVVTGPYYNKTHGRWYVYINMPNERVEIYLARFLIQEHLGRILDTTEHVHHKDEVKTNDVLSNLEVLTISEHSAITKHTKNESIVIEVCLNCKHEFEMDNRMAGVRSKSWERMAHSAPKAVQVDSGANDEDGTHSRRK